MTAPCRGESMPPDGFEAAGRHSVTPNLYERHHAMNHTTNPPAVVYDIIVVPSYETARLRRLGERGYAVVGTTHTTISRLVFNHFTDRCIEADQLVPALVLQRARSNGNEAHK